MSATITLPDTLAAKLRARAKIQQQLLEEFVLNILSRIAELADEQADVPTPEEVVARIKALPPDPTCIRLASGSLAEALQDKPAEFEFNLESWRREWAAVEVELKAITRANDIAEGRGWYI